MSDCRVRVVEFEQFPKCLWATCTRVASPELHSPSTSGESRRQQVLRGLSRVWKGHFRTFPHELQAPGKQTGVEGKEKIIYSKLVLDAMRRCHLRRVHMAWKAGQPFPLPREWDREGGLWGWLSEETHLQPSILTFSFPLSRWRVLLEHSLITTEFIQWGWRASKVWPDDASDGKREVPWRLFVVLIIHESLYPLGILNWIPPNRYIGSTGFQKGYIEQERGKGMVGYQKFFF